MLIIEGDLIDALINKEVDAIGHQTNCFHTMGTGIAKSLKERFPEVLLADKETQYGDLSKLGGISKAIIPNVGIIYNLYGQYTYGRNMQQTDYYFLKGSIQKAINDLILNNKFSLGLPFGIGCGNAGGNLHVMIDFVLNEIYKDLPLHFQLRFYRIK